jgi:holo-[acyl-carrier protein] synthase
MQQVLDRWGDRFKNRVFLAGEQAYCETRAVPCRHYAGRFAVKEAVTKAFGTGIGAHIGWLDIEVVRSPQTGAPSVTLSDRARALARERGADDVLVSLAHTRTHTVAHALLLAAGGG